MKNERRKFIRTPLSIPLDYRKIHKSINYKGELAETVNISQGGLCFRAKKPANQGDLIAIKLPFADKVYEVKGQVVYCEKNDELGNYNIGVAFQSADQAFQAKLIEQMYLISEYRDLLTIQRGREVSLEEASREWVKRYAEKFSKLYD